MEESTNTLSKNKESKAGENPRKRIPLRARNILTAPNKPGFVRRFVNDKADRVNAFKDAGWDVVTDDGLQVGDPKIGRASSMGSSVNPHVGAGQRAVLMEIKEEFYLEDKAAAQAKITAVENEMKRKGPGKDGLSGEVSIS